jgi:hypothetical protein
MSEFDIMKNRLNNADFHLLLHTKNLLKSVMQRIPKFGGILSTLDDTEKLMHKHIGSSASVLQCDDGCEQIG